MVMVLCCDCNKKIKGRLRTCVKCGKPICYGCSRNNYCSVCHPLNQDEIIINDYFKEKYKSDVKWERNINEVLKA